MCGIIGLNFKSNNPKIFSIASYRGPDSTNFNHWGNFTLGHNRLEIVDHNPLSNQPFVSSDGNYIIVFNGEVYNYQDLIKNLSSKYNFKTNSDTEAILYSYIEKGENCVHDFRGMFSFAIYDIKKDKLFCARDRFGVKPFNYYYDGSKFIFASEIKVILEALDKKPEVSHQAIIQYLHYLYVPHPGTIFQDIYKLPPASTLTYEKGKIEIKKYWDIKDFAGKNLLMSEVDILEQLDQIMDESVRIRMIADVELGSFLSGGLDSGSILYYMCRNSSKAVNTFTLGFEDAHLYDERKDAKIMVDHFQTNHTEIIINPNAAELLPKMVHHFDEPFGNPTSLLIHELTKEAKKYATVALAGDGGDEVFGGYPRYQAAQLSQKLNFIPSGVFKGLSFFTNILPESTSGFHQLRRIKTFVNSLKYNEDHRYEEWIGYFSNEELKKILVNYKPYSPIVSQLWRDQDGFENTLKASIVDLKTFLPNNLLQYGDIMSMANAFEVRCPLIDQKLVEFITSVDPKYKIYKGDTKYLLRKLLTGKVPERIIHKPKLGLNPPMGIWLKKDLKNLVDNYLSVDAVKRRGIFKPEYIQRIIHEHNTNKKDRSLYIWALIVLEEWHRQYID